MTRSQVISAASTHISTGSSRTSRSAVVIRSTGVPTRATMLPSAIGQVVTRHAAVGRRRRAPEARGRLRPGRATERARSRSPAVRSSATGITAVAIPPITPVRTATPSPSASMLTRMSPGATSGRPPLSPMSPLEHSRLPSGGLDLEALRHRRRDRQRAKRAVAGAVLPCGERAVGGDPQRERVARDQAFDVAGGNPLLILDTAVQRAVCLANAVAREPGQRDADRQEDRGQDQQELGRRRQRREAPAARSAFELSVHGRDGRALS